MTDETNTNETGTDATEQMAAGVERVGETGVELRMEFPDSKVREDFLIAFRGWLKEYKRTAETAYLVQALVAERVAAAAGDDTAGHFFWAPFTHVYHRINQATAPVFGHTPVRYSDWMPW